MNNDGDTDKSGAVLARHCPQLGHPIAFSYCMAARADTSGAAKPCKKIMDCWWETFDVQSFLKDTLPQADYSELVNKEPGNRRAAGLFDAIERALENKDPKP